MGSKSVLLCRRDIYNLFKENSLLFADQYQDTYYKKNKSSVRRRCLYDKQGTFLCERWVDVYGNPIHKPQVEQVLLTYKFTRHRLSSGVKVDVLELSDGCFVVLSRLDESHTTRLDESHTTRLDEIQGLSCPGKVYLLTNKVDLQGYIYSSDPLILSNQDLTSS
ncbi:hypothetical protein BQ9231_00295 [Cedratvirus lausannensis]|uniref:Uncharacterized protein n=1 Tax=Cedratvirus lausannensis TaxID=2023205 RepID=A0A285PWY5_9VIRU|nr:hypothetical protein BQ9231_00295 [Cedratvirus lausannensis]